MTHSVCFVQCHNFLTGSNFFPCRSSETVLRSVCLVNSIFSSQSQSFYVSLSVSQESSYPRKKSSSFNYNYLEVLLEQPRLMIMIKYLSCKVDKDNVEKVSQVFVVFVCVPIFFLKNKKLAYTCGWKLRLNERRSWKS